MKFLLFFIISYTNLCSQSSNKFTEYVINNTIELKLPYSSEFVKDSICLSLNFQDCANNLLVDKKRIVYKCMNQNDSVCSKSKIFVLGKINVDSFIYVLVQSNCKPGINYNQYGIWLFDKNFNLLITTSINRCEFKNDTPHFYISKEKFIYDFSVNEAIDLNIPRKISKYFYQLDRIKIFKKSEEDE